MTYPSRYLEFTPTPVTGRIEKALEDIRKNDRYSFMAMAYGGEIPERYYGPPAVAGPWLCRAFYSLPGFDHSYTNANPNREFDRIEMQSANVRIAWNFNWQYVTAPTDDVHLLYSHWYYSPFADEPYDYLGRLFHEWTAGALVRISWSTAADPNPPPK